MFVVWHPSAVTGISALVATQPLETWKDYLGFRAIERASAFLPKAFGDEAFAFYGQVLTGTPKQRDRWKRGVAVTNAALGEAVGQLYARRYFPASEKARAQEMVRNLMEAFRRRIDRLDWMAPETKGRAKAKLATLKVGVGYPDKWRDYSGLEIVRGDALGNAERAGLFEYRRNLKKLGQPIDRDEWVMTPQTVNAVNLPVMNAMNFPAAILQPPYFDSARTAAMNYGATGATIGHEVSHSFDDQGALFDETGRLHNWWTKEDFAHFQAAAAELVKQYDGYRPFPDLAVNGKLTLSENIADVAGLAAAYDAYRLSLGGKPAPVVQGLSGDQQFFLAFTQSWRQKIREPALRQRIMTDSHSPGEYRADTVRNLDAWYDAFDVKPGEKLYLAPAEPRPRLVSVAEGGQARKRRLGGTDRSVFPVGLGCMGFSWGYRDDSVDEAAAIDVIRRAIDLGVDHFDTADVYGPFANESLLGRALADRREQVVIATKAGLIVEDKATYRFGRNGRPEHIREACDGSLERLGVEVIDLYYLHRVDPQIPRGRDVGRHGGSRRRRQGPVPRHLRGVRGGARARLPHPSA